jgi:hypothetical protein
VRCFDLRIASLLILNLVTTIACYFPLYNACFYHPNCVTWNFTLVVWSVMVLWVATNGAATKPRASCGRPTQGCAARHALISWFLVMIHCGTTSMCYSQVNSSLVISPYLIVRPISQTESSRTSNWSYIKDNLWRTGHRLKASRPRELVSAIDDNALLPWLTCVLQKLW